MRSQGAYGASDVISSETGAGGKERRSKGRGARVGGRTETERESVLYSDAWRPTHPPKFGERERRVGLSRLVAERTFARD